MASIDLVFLTLLSLVFYSYIGYGLILLSLVKIKLLIFGKKKLNEFDELPTVTLLIAAWNEEDYIEAKIINSFITTSMIRSTGDRIIVRILREILTILIGHQYRYWMPLD